MCTLKIFLPIFKFGVRLLALKNICSLAEGAALLGHEIDFQPRGQAEICSWQAKLELGIHFYKQQCYEYFDIVYLVQF